MSLQDFRFVTRPSLLASYLDLSPEFDDLSGGNAEEGCCALGVVLQERKQSLSPQRHAHDVVPGNNCLTANVVGDVREIDAVQFALIAGELEPSGDGGTLH